MKRILLAALALGATATATAAEPKRMTDAEMEDVAAGLLAISPAIGPVHLSLNVAASAAVANAIGALSDGVTSALVEAGTGQTNTAGFANGVTPARP